MARNDSKSSFKVYLDFQTTGKSIKEVDAEFKRLNNTIRRDLIPGTNEYNQAVAKQRELGKVLDDHKAKVKGVGGIWSSLSQEVKAFGMIAIGALGFQAITGQLNNLIRKSAELSDAYADVQKTTGLTATEVEALGKQLGKIDTRTSRMELLKLAAEAGKLGISGAGNVKKFVEEADKIKVALGEDLGEDAILAIGKLSDVFGTGMLNIGSAINSLGAASAASESYLVDFAARLGGVAKTAGISAPEILGYGAVLDSLGLQAEMSSTALSNFFIDFTKNAAKFESAAGMANGSLSELIGKEGTNAGFIAFLENLKASSTGADDFLKRLEKLGIDGSRGAQVFLTLSNNIGKVKEQQQIANTEFDKGTSIIDEFNVKNETFAAKLEKLQKQLSGFFTNNAFVDGMKNVISAWSDYLNIPVSEKLEEEQLQLNALVTSIIDTNANQELRNSLIKQLQAEYPDFIGNIDAERISNEYLRDRLAEVNQQYINKIILQKQQEKVTKQQTQAADEFVKAQENLVNFNKQAAKMEKEFGIESGDNLTIDARMSRLRTVIQARAKENNIFENVSLTWQSGELLGFYEQALQYEQKYQESKYESNKLLQEFQQMQKELNTEITKVDAKDPLGLGKAFGTSDKSVMSAVRKMTDEQKKEYVKQKDQLQKHLDELMRLRIDNMEDASLKAEAQADYDFYLAVKKAESEISNKKVLNDTLVQLEINYQEKLKNIRETASKNRLDALAQELDAYVKTEQKAQLDLERQILQGITGIPFTDKPGTNVPSEGLDESNIKDETPEDKARKTINSIGQVGNNVMGIINSVSAAQQAELAEFLNAQDQKKQALADLYESGRISAENYNKKVKALDAESDRKKRELMQKEARRQKMGQIFSSIINTASAVVEALPNFGLATAVGIAGALQTSLIAAQPIPEFAKGGFTFADGGPVMQPKVGLIGEAGPEWVAPNWMLRNPATADVIGSLEAMRTNRSRAFADGGATMPTNNSVSQFSVNNNGELVNMLKSMQQTNMMLMDRLNRPFMGVIGWNDFDTRELEEKRTRYSDILSDNTIS